MRLNHEKAYGENACSLFGVLRNPFVAKYKNTIQ